MKKIIYLIMALLLLGCTRKEIYTETTITRQLQTSHFVSILQIENSFGFGTEDQDVKYKVVDTHVAWLEYSNGYKTKLFTYDVVHSVDYTPTLLTQTPETLVGNSYIYDNGFNIDVANVIKCYFEIEYFESVTIYTADEALVFEPKDLNFCKIVPQSICFTKYEASQIHGIIMLGFEDCERGISSSLELPVTFKII